MERSTELRTRRGMRDELAILPDTFLRDPADRMIVATARAHGLPVLTSDRKIIDSGLVTVWTPERCGWFAEALVCQSLRCGEALSPFLARPEFRIPNLVRDATSEL